MFVVNDEVAGRAVRSRTTASSDPELAATQQKIESETIKASAM